MGFFKKRDIGIDLGNYKTIIVERGNESPLFEECIHPRNANPPYVDGLFGQFGYTRTLEKKSELSDYLTYAIGKACSGKRLVRPRVLIAVPLCISDRERQVIIKSCKSTGVGFVNLVPSLMMAAIGAGLPVSEPDCQSLVLDIGAHTSEFSAFSVAGMKEAESFPWGGAQLTHVILEYFKTCHSMTLTVETAENLKKAIQLKPCYESLFDVSGWIDGRPHQIIQVTNKELCSVLQESLMSFRSSIAKKLRNFTNRPDGNYEIVLSGGGALLQGLDQCLSEELNVVCKVVTDPQRAVSRGLALAREMDVLVQTETECTAIEL